MKRGNTRVRNCLIMDSTWASQMAILVKNLYAKKKKKKNLYANAGDIRDLCWIPGLGKTPGGGHGKSCQNSCLENSMDREVWQAIVRVAESDTTEVA